MKRNERNERCIGLPTMFIGAFMLIISLQSTISAVSVEGGANVTSISESKDATVAALQERIVQLEKLIAQLTKRVRELEERQTMQGRTTFSLLMHLRNQQLQQRYVLRQLLNHPGSLKNAINSLYGQRARTLLASLTPMQATTAGNVEGGAGELTTPVEALTAPTGAPGAGVGAGLWQAMNPDISVIADFMVKFGGKNPLGSYRGSLLREVELAFQADVDPFARLDAFVHLSSEHAHIEQAELTILDSRVLGLPERLQIHGGILLANIGKLNTIHIPEQPMADPPLLHQFF
ncbi:MAG TPA: hypothetical protein EYP10_10395, partial [Armatimonadetes bacterium]|nr:hypothetical protein [Armatimonadota bacterium]